MASEITSSRDMLLSEPEIHKQAAKGQFYDLSSHNWNSLGRLEYALRSIFSRLTSYVASVEQACIRRSWKSIQDMPETPNAISQDIHTYFEVSRSRSHYLNIASRSITALCTKKLVAEGQIWQSAYPLSIDVQKDAKLRLFTISNIGKTVATVLSTDWGKLDFYDQTDKLYLHNECDLLYTESRECFGSDVVKSCRELIGKVKLESDTLGNTSTKIDIFMGRNIPLATVAAEGDPTTFVFRDFHTRKQVLAVAVLKGSYRNPKWSITFVANAINPKIRYELFVLALLKHSQKYHLGNPDREDPYIPNLEYAKQQMA